MPDILLRTIEIVTTILPYKVDSIIIELLVLVLVLFER